MRCQAAKLVEASNPSTVFVASELPIRIQPLDSGREMLRRGGFGWAKPASAAANRPTQEQTACVMSAFMNENESSADGYDGNIIASATLVKFYVVKEPMDG